jgi:hypothetical protein
MVFTKHQANARVETPAAIRRADGISQNRRPWTKAAGRWQVFACALVLALMLSSARAHGCTSNSDCDDGLFCNGAETCDSNQQCQSGTPPTCGLGNADPQCNDASCDDSMGCVVTPKIDGFGCIDDDVCTTHDICLSGVCVGMGGADSDGDGYCDAAEMQAQCSTSDAAEVPLQANVYSGGRGNSGGEVLLTFRSPSDRDVKVSTNASCTASGHCNLLTGLCTSGKVSDPCSSDSECSQPASTCRIVVNYGGAPDLGVQLPKDRRSAFEVTLKIAQLPKVDLTPAFLPVTPGCSRKVDVILPSSFTRGSLRFRIRGTTAGKRRTDRDRIKFVP